MRRAMHRVVVRDYLAYSKEHLDPALGTNKEHEEFSLALARAILQSAAALPGFPDFLEAASEMCFAARLLPKNGTQAERLALLDALFDDNSATPVCAFVVRRQVRQLSISDADAIPPGERKYFVAVEGSPMLVDPDQTDRVFGNASVVVKFSAGQMLKITVIAEKAVDLLFYQSAEVRSPQKLSVSGLQPDTIWKLQSCTAAPSAKMTMAAYDRMPAGPNGIPDAMASRLARMLENHLRLPVLTTAAACAAGRERAGPLAFERCYVRASGRLTHFNMPFHPSSAACMCGAHGHPVFPKAKSTVQLTICGTAFEQDGRCPRCADGDGWKHGVCTRHFSIELRCVHRAGEPAALVLPLTHGLSASARVEFLNALGILGHFFQSKAKVTPLKLGQLDAILLRLRGADYCGDNDHDALEAIQSGHIAQETAGVLKTSRSTWSASEQRARATHAHLFKRKRPRLGPSPPPRDATPPPAAAPAAAPPAAPAAAPVAAPEAAQASKESTVKLDEFIDVEGLTEARRLVQNLLSSAGTSLRKLRLQSFLQYLDQLEAACKEDGELELDGPAGLVCYKLPVLYRQKRDNYGRLNTQNTKTFEDFYKGERRVLCLQGCPRLLRPFLCGRFCDDWDMKNAQPTILLQLAKRLRNGAHNMPTLQHWVDDRPGLMAHIAEVHDIQEDVKDTCKELVISLIFGGEYEHWIRKKRMPLDIQSPLVKRLARELAELRATVFYHKEFQVHVQKERKRHVYEGQKDAAAADRSIFAVLAQNAENEILNVIRDGVHDQGFAVESLQFDGLFVIRRSDGVQLDVKPIEAEIRRKLSYEIQLEPKELYFEGPWPALTLT